MWSVNYDGAWTTEICEGKLKVRLKATQCLTLCNTMDCIFHGIIQARILEWVALPFSRESSQPRDQTQVFHIAGWFFINWVTGKPEVKLGLVLFSDPLWIFKITMCHGSWCPFLPNPGVRERAYGPTSTMQLENAGPGFRNLELKLLRASETVVDQWQHRCTVRAADSLCPVSKHKKGYVCCFLATWLLSCKLCAKCFQWLKLTYNYLLFWEI